MRARPTARAACGLYYLAELCEEFTSLTKRIIYWAILGVSFEHLLLLVLEPALPRLLVMGGLVAHGCYFQLLRSFPFMHPSSPAFLASALAAALSTYGWLRHFFGHYHRVTTVLGFMLLNAWLVPFAFFISLSVNESVLPGSSEPRPKRREGMLMALFNRAREHKDAITGGSKRVI